MSVRRPRSAPATPAAGLTEGKTRRPNAVRTATGRAQFHHKSASAIVAMTFFALSECCILNWLILIVFSVFFGGLETLKRPSDQSAQEICGKKLFINLALCVTPWVEIARLNLT
ncbi:MAG: hypothetical protein VYE69_25945 [Pseudomonadota bacterium]|nr:hypothetical protein [Pseudomonadota bacterium]